jgi:RimJ/RimL family protein N-acetyltransferase
MGIRQPAGLSTARLDLLPLSRVQLGYYLDREDLFIREYGRVSREILTPVLQRAIRMKLSKMAGASREDSLWMTYWLIRVRESDFGAGMIGFKGLPDLLGEVEVGYGMDPEYRNKGYITEAALGLIGWAFADPRCRRIVAPNTLRSNPASNRVLEKMGMRVYQESPVSLSWCLEKEDQIPNQ